MIQLIYPDCYKVSEERIMSWAEDARLNGETEEEAETVDDAIRILQDLGHITVGFSKKEAERGNDGL